MSPSPDNHFAWLNGYVVLVSVVQIGLVGYWWRGRVRRRPFFVVGGVILAAVWGVVLFAPFEHNVVVAMPTGDAVGTIESFAAVVSTAILAGLVVGINQLILVAVRVGLRWKRT